MNPSGLYRGTSSRKRARLHAFGEEEPQISQISQIGTGVLSQGSAFVLELESRLGLITEHAFQTQLDLEGLLRHRLEVTGQARCQSAAQVFNLRNLRFLFWPALAAVTRPERNAGQSVTRTLRLGRFRLNLSRDHADRPSHGPTQKGKPVQTSRRYSFCCKMVGTAIAVRRRLWDG